MTNHRATSGVRFGISGLDDLFDHEGGIPPKTLFLIQGYTGIGKTTLALQFLLQGVREGASCLLVTNAETPAQLQTIAASHGWSLDGLHITEWMEEANGDASNIEQDYTLFPEAEVEVGATLQSLFESVARVRPDRLVIDSISALRALAPSAAFHRRQLKRIRTFLWAYDCTTLLLDDAAISEKDMRRQTLADGLLELQQVDLAYGGDRRRLRVRKLRGCTYIGGYHDFRIRTGGIEVYPRLVASRHELVDYFEPAVSRVAALDALTGGGLPRGTSTLILGPAGSGKSTLGAAWVHAAAAQGESSAVCLFDESVDSYLARSRGLNLDLTPAIEAGQVHISHLDPAELSPGEISHLLVRRVDDDGARLVVIDSVNGYLHSAAEEPQVLLHLRELLSYLARRQVITLLIMTRHGILGNNEAAPLDMSFLADNVILLRYFEAAGSIRQALSMVKKRTGAHERTIRELSFTGGVISLGEPLTEFSGVLSGWPVFHGGLAPGSDG